MEEKKRLIYPDICKFIAIIIVTASHCAQSISDEVWTNFMGGTKIDIAFNMPLFMIMSGWFVNLKKIRETNIFKYLLSKTYRLIVPAISWYIIFCILTGNKICIINAFLFYWYLSALFICLVIISISAKDFFNNKICILVSTIGVLLIPHSYFANINYMFPFIWAGYYLRKIFESNKPYIKDIFMIISLIIGSLLIPKWSFDKTVYVTPLKVLSINFVMVYYYIYRFTIGLCLSVPLIYFAKKIESSNYAYSFAKYGKYTLITYTFSFIFNGILSIFLPYFNLNTNKLLIIDFTSCLRRAKFSQ